MPHAAKLRTGHEDIAHLQRTALHEDGGNRSAALIELGFNYGALGAAMRIGFKVEKFGLQQNSLFELVEIGTLRGGYFDGERIAAEILDLDLVLQKLRLHPHGIGVGLVDLVDRNNDGHAC